MLANHLPFGREFSWWPQTTRCGCASRHTSLKQSTLLSEFGRCSFPQCFIWNFKQSIFQAKHLPRQHTLQNPWLHVEIPVIDLSYNLQVSCLQTAPAHFFYTNGTYKNVLNGALPRKGKPFVGEDQLPQVFAPRWGAGEVEVGVDWLCGASGLELVVVGLHLHFAGLHCLHAAQPWF